MITPEQAFEKWWDKHDGFTPLRGEFFQAFLAGIQYQELHQISVLADIRKAVGDGEGRLSQEELVKRIEGLANDKQKSLDMIAQLLSAIYPSKDGTCGVYAWNVGLAKNFLSEMEGKSVMTEKEEA